MDDESFYSLFSPLCLKFEDDVSESEADAKSRWFLNGGLTISSKSVACIRLDDLYAVTSDYSLITEDFENFLQPLERMTTQLFSRMARTD